MSVLNKIVSWFPDIGTTTNGKERNLLDLLQSDEQRDTILHLRKQTDKAIQKELKDKLPYYTVAGTFSHRCNDGLVQPSGLAAVDLDSAEDYDVLDLLEQMKANPYIAYAGLSCRGQRIFCIVPFKYPDKYVKHYERLVKSFVDWGLPMGDDCHKKISQPRFVSWNDENTQFFNHDAKPYSLLPAEKIHYIIPRQRTTSSIIGSSPFEIAAQLLEKKGNTFQDKNHHNYIFEFCSWLNKMSVPQSEAEQYVNDHLMPLSEIKSNCIDYPYKYYSAEFGTFDFDRDSHKRYFPPINKPQKAISFDYRAFQKAEQTEPPKQNFEQPQEKEISAVQEVNPIRETNNFIPVNRNEKPKPESWEQVIMKLEHYFENTTLPTEPVKLNHCSTITNISKFIDSHLATMKANNGKRTFVPYLERLQELKRYLTAGVAVLT